MAVRDQKIMLKRDGEIMGLSFSVREERAVRRAMAETGYKAISTFLREVSEAAAGEPGIDKAAAACNMPPSEWIRTVVLDALGFHVIQAEQAAQAARFLARKRKGVVS